MMLEPPLLRNLHEEYAAGLRSALRVEGVPVDAANEGEPAVEYLPYGPSEADQSISIVGTYGMVEAEYAAIRRGAGIVDRAQRAVMRVRGGNRREFLNRLLTQELKELVPGRVMRSFWLNRKGRIEADLLIVEREEDTLLDLDRHQRDATITSLQSFMFTEDAEISATDDIRRLAIHGPRAAEVLSTVMTTSTPLLLSPGEATNAQVGSAGVTLARHDETGEPGYELLIESASLESVWRGLVESDIRLSQGKRRIRPIGWHAYNIARIEAGTPLMNIDFGPANLPHETGILHERASFTKGCYLGQEVVARMEHLGRPKQVLVGLRVESDQLPVAGGQIFEIRDDRAGDQVGVVTSSTLSPMLGAVPIAFAMIRTKHAALDSTVLVNAEGAQARARVHALRFLPE